MSLCTQPYCGSWQNLELTSGRLLFLGDQSCYLPLDFGNKDCVNLASQLKAIVSLSSATDWYSCPLFLSLTNDGHIIWVLHSADLSSVRLYVLKGFHIIDGKYAQETFAGSHVLISHSTKEGEEREGGESEQNIVLKHIKSFGTLCPNILSMQAEQGPPIKLLQNTKLQNMSTSLFTLSYPTTQSPNPLYADNVLSLLLMLTLTNNYFLNSFQWGVCVIISIIIIVRTCIPLVLLYQEYPGGKYRRLLLLAYDTSPQLWDRIHQQNWRKGREE